VRDAPRHHRPDFGPKGSQILERRFRDAVVKDPDLDRGGPLTGLPSRWRFSALCTRGRGDYCSS
jgi:hypothetical protein